MARMTADLVPDFERIRIGDQGFGLEQVFLETQFGLRYFRGLDGPHIGAGEDDVGF
jgi:hypothetical protein